MWIQLSDSVDLSVREAGQEGALDPLLELIIGAIQIVSIAPVEDRSKHIRDIDHGEREEGTFIFTVSADDGYTSNLAITDELKRLVGEEHAILAREPSQAQRLIVKDGRRGVNSLPQPGEGNSPQAGEGVLCT